MLYEMIGVYTLLGLCAAIATGAAIYVRNHHVPLGPIFIVCGILAAISGIIMVVDAWTQKRKASATKTTNSSKE